MTDRKHCPDCELGYTDEESHKLVHDAVVTAQPADSTSGEIPQSVA